MFDRRSQHPSDDDSGLDARTRELQSQFEITPEAAQVLAQEQLAGERLQDQMRKIWGPELPLPTVRELTNVCSWLSQCFGAQLELEAIFRSSIDATITGRRLTVAGLGEDPFEDNETVMLGLNYAGVLERYFEESWQPANKAIRNGPELAQFVRNLMELQVGIFITPTGETGLQPNEFLEQLPRGTAYTVDLPGIKEEVRIGELNEDCTPEERYDHYLELSRASVLYELQRLEQRSPLSDDVTPAEHKNLYDWVGMVRQAVADGNLETPTVQRRIVLAGLTAFDIVGTISPETAVDNLHRRIDASIEVMESLPPTAFSPDLTPDMRDDQVQTMRFLRDISEKQRGWIERMLAK